MPTLTAPPNQSPPDEYLRRGLHRFTVAKYHEMIDAGIFKPGERVELLEGWVVEQMTRKPIHDATIQQIIDNAMKRMPRGWSCRPQCAITTLESEPEPDVAVVRGTAKDYRNRHPGPRDVGLIIEVADSSIDIDRDWKSRIYSRALIPNYWIVNLVNWTVEQFSDPTGPCDNPTYRQDPIAKPGDTIRLVIGADTIEIPVSDLLLTD